MNEIVSTAMVLTLGGCVILGIFLLIEKWENRNGK